MAEKRMFSNKIVFSDAFLEMPDSTQNLYYALSMSADDDGFVDKPRSIMRMTGKKEDDFKLLVVKGFIIPFESGVIVIKHWRINNYLRSDRYKETTYTEEKAQLSVKQNGAYTIKSNVGIPVVDQLDTQYRLDKNRLEENRIDNIVASAPDVCNKILSFWNERNIIKHQKLSEKIEKAIKKALKTYTEDEIKTYIDRYATVLADKDYFLNYKWTLDEFLSRKEGISSFEDDGSKWANYRPSGQQEPQQRFKNGENGEIIYD